MNPSSTLWPLVRSALAEPDEAPAAPSPAPVTADAELRERLLAVHGLAVLNAAWRLLRHRKEAIDVAENVFRSALRRVAATNGSAVAGAALETSAVKAAIEKIRAESAAPDKDCSRLLPAFDSSGHFARPVQPWAGAVTAALKGSASHERLWAALEQLPLQYRGVLALRDFERAETREVAAVLGVSEETVKRRLNSARLALLTLLGT